MRADWQRRLMALLWLLAIVRVFYDAPVIVHAALTALFLYLLLAIPVSGQLNRVIALLATGLALALCAYEGHWQSFLDGFIFSLVFTAFLPTLQLIRATLDVGPEMAQSRALFAKMATGQRGNAFMVGGNILGSVLTLGALPMLVPLLPEESDKERNHALRIEAAQAILRGLALTIAWSPFTVGMALALVHWPQLHLWQIMGVGFVAAGLGITLSILLAGRSAGGWSGLLRALRGFRPLAIPLGGTLAIVVIATSLIPLTTIETIIIVLPILCSLWVLSKNIHEVRRVARTTYQGLDRLGGELLLFCGAVTLGRVMQESSLLNTWFSHPVIAELPTGLVIAIIMAIGFMLACLGFHSVVLGACVMVLLAPFADRIADIVAVHILLFGWSCGALLSLSALSIVVAANLFEVSIPRLILGRNMLFMALYGCSLFFLLYGLNAVVL